MHTLEVCHKSVKNTLGLFNHYFVRIPSLYLEIHPGAYYGGTHHNLDTTKKYVITETIVCCNDCLDHILTESLNMTHLWYYPIINCETLTRGLCNKVPISIQTILFTGMVISSFGVLAHFAHIQFVLFLMCLHLLWIHYCNCKKMKIVSCCHKTSSI